MKCVFNLQQSPVLLLFILCSRRELSVYSSGDSAATQSATPQAGGHDFSGEQTGGPVRYSFCMVLHSCQYQVSLKSLG